MDTHQLKSHLKASLAPTLGQAEATSVTRLLLEDVFATKPGQRARVLHPQEIEQITPLIARLLAGEPVQYITGIADFYGLQLHVTPAVLIPRPETEELVEWILEGAPSDGPLRVLDIGTGSGCIPLVLQSRRRAWECIGVDVSQAALDVAVTNRDRLSLPVQFIQSDILNAPGGLPENGIDVLVSNPPYIPPSERARMGKSTLAYEPPLALFVPENDPLLFYRRIAAVGLAVLTASGQVYFETNEYNNEEVANLLVDRGYTDIRRKRDLQGKWRMIRAMRPPSPAPSAD